MPSYRAWRDSPYLDGAISSSSSEDGPIDASGKGDDRRRFPVYMLVPVKLQHLSRESDGGGDGEGEGSREERLIRMEVGGVWLWRGGRKRRPDQIFVHEGRERQRSPNE